MSTSTPSTSHGAGTAATDSPAAIEAGIKANDDRAFEESLGAMSPFEVKNLLVKMAKKGDEGTTRTLLNAGRGNPNWITTLPREAFFPAGRLCHGRGAPHHGRAGLRPGGHARRRGRRRAFPRLP